MCEFCIKHGEGKKWYEVMQNYSRELYHQKNREQFIRNFLSQGLAGTVEKVDKYNRLNRKMPAAFRFISKMGTMWMKQSHFGQVVTLEDAEKIVDMVTSITRLPCVCRGATKGDNNARYCMGLGVDMTGLLNDIPELKESLEVLTPEEAKNLLQKFDREGLVHSVWTLKTPYIGALCNCDHDCLAYRAQVSYGLIQLMFKGEEVADIDPNLCSGCRKCTRLCQFGAIEYSALQGKCIVNLMKCYGCGVCRSGCNKEAVSMLERSRLPELTGVW